MMTPGEINIVRNLRAVYKEKIEDMSDRELLNEFNDWNLSDKSETFLHWIGKGAI